MALGGWDGGGDLRVLYGGGRERVRSGVVSEDVYGEDRGVDGGEGGGRWRGRRRR